MPNQAIFWDPFSLALRHRVRRIVRPQRKSTLNRKWISIVMIAMLTLAAVIGFAVWFWLFQWHAVNSHGSLQRLSPPRETATRAAGPLRVMFIYWGRRGALPRFTLELLKHAQSNPNLEVTVSISESNEVYSAYQLYSTNLFPVKLFGDALGALTCVWRIPLIRRRLARRLELDKTELVVSLMPHIWNPYIVPVVKRSGASYATLIHDAHAHPGDTKGLLQGWMMREVPHADLVFTLSKSVAAKLRTNRYCADKVVSTLFHPDLDYGTIDVRRNAKMDSFRLLFLGRILPYKGFPLLMQAMDILQNKGVPVHLSIYGEGDLKAFEPRLREMGADVLNKWLSEEEIRTALGNCDAVILSHTEASQSGVVATAMAAGLPVISTPVGGLAEQVEDGKTGVLADAVSSNALAKAVMRLMADRELYSHICENLTSTKEDRSMSRFIDECLIVAIQNQIVRPYFKTPNGQKQRPLVLEPQAITA